MDGAEIPREQWADYFEQLALEHEGWIVDLEWPGHEEDLDAESEHTLEDVETYFEKGESRIVLTLAGRDSIVIEDPERIMVTTGEEYWDDELVEFETPSTALILRFRFPGAEAELNVRGGEDREPDRIGSSTSGIEEERWIH